MIYSTFPFCDFPEYYLSHKENRHGAFSSDHEYTVLWYRVVGLLFSSFFQSMSEEVLLYSVHTVHRCLLRLMVHFVTCGLTFYSEIAYICVIDLCFQTSVAASSISLFYPCFPLLITRSHFPWSTLWLRFAKLYFTILIQLW